MSRPARREQNWYPISALGWFTSHIRGGRRGYPVPAGDAPARPGRPYVLDDATVARIIRVHRDQAGDLALFQNQAGRWKAGPGLTAGQRAEVAAYEKLLAELRELNGEVLAVAAELSHGTIETVLAKVRSGAGSRGAAAQAACIAWTGRPGAQRWRRRQARSSSSAARSE